MRCAFGAHLFRTLASQSDHTHADWLELCMFSSLVSGKMAVFWLRRNHWWSCPVQCFRCYRQDRGVWQEGTACIACQCSARRDRAADEAQLPNETRFHYCCQDRAVWREEATWIACPWSAWRDRGARRERAAWRDRAAWQEWVAWRTLPTICLGECDFPNYMKKLMLLGNVSPYHPLQSHCWANWVRSIHSASLWPGE